MPNQDNSTGHLDFALGHLGDIPKGAAACEALVREVKQLAEKGFAVLTEDEEADLVRKVASINCTLALIAERLTKDLAAARQGNPSWN